MPVIQHRKVIQDFTKIIGKIEYFIIVVYNNVNFFNIIVDKIKDPLLKAS